MFACARWCKTRSGMEVMGQFCSLVGGGEGGGEPSLHAGAAFYFSCSFQKTIAILDIDFLKAKELNKMRV